MEATMFFTKKQLKSMSFVTCSKLQHIDFNIKFNSVQPHGGKPCNECCLWGSPESDHSWLQYCKHEWPEALRGKKRIRFAIKPDAKIRIINNIEEYSKFLNVIDDLYSLNVEKFFDNVDIVFFNDNDIAVDDDDVHSYALKMWDCNTIMVRNLDAIVEI